MPLTIADSTAVVSRWREFLERMPDQVVRARWAQEHRGMNTLEAYQFAGGTIEPEIREAITAWRNSIVALHRQQPGVFHNLCTSLGQLCENSPPLNRTAFLQDVTNLMKRHNFPTFRHAACDLVVGEKPYAGIFVGLAMVNNGHPKDGETLIRQGLRIMEETPDSFVLWKDVITEFRAKYPPRD